VKSLKRIKLKKGATIAVIGGGPAGSFFAMAMQRQMKLLGFAFRVVILEKKKELGFYGDSFAMACREGCNYCAGGISPRMCDVLKEMSLELPPPIIQSKVRLITIHGHWKNIELKVPQNRQMLSVYRGARPAKRVDRFYAFDSFLLENAVKGGAELVTGDVYDVQPVPGGGFQVCFTGASGEQTLQADFVVFSCGINQVPGVKLDDDPLVKTIQRFIPEFKPPPVRRTLIFELEAQPEFLQDRSGEVFFIESGSTSLQLEMCSIIPKEQFVTVVLIGASIDSASNDEDVVNIIKQFLELRHVQKILPKEVSLACICRPNMAVGAAQEPYGDCMAVIGDMVTSRLYKDGILSAHRTASALARAVTEVGIDSASLKKGYEPAIRRFISDNYFGDLVFMMHSIMFRHPSLSRILYQAVLTERKNQSLSRRKLENILWKIASGDARYRDIFFAMINPLTLWTVFVGGGLTTLRNFITESFFGLDWRGLGRFTTGVYKEELEVKSQEFKRIISEFGIIIPESPEFEKMYSIKIRASQQRIFQEVGKFGDKDQQFFTPNMIRVRRIEGEPLQAGGKVRYEVLFGLINFTAIIEKIYHNEIIIYRVESGFPKGGVLIFEIEKKGEQNSLLSIYVAYNFPKGGDFFSAGFWTFFRSIFPAYVHDVLWNHSLCKLKDIAESQA